MGASLSKQSRKQGSSAKKSGDINTTTEYAPRTDPIVMEAPSVDATEEVSDSRNDEVVPGYTTIFQQSGSMIERVEGFIARFYGYEALILKTGERVTPAEAIAMRLVTEHTDIPSPKVLSTRFEGDDQAITMTLIPGQPLSNVWTDLDNHHRTRICQEIWGMVGKLRTIPRPAEREGQYLCLADGSPSEDPLVRDDVTTPARPLKNDEEVRARIYENYLACHGHQYEHVLLDMLPRSTESVFTHGDIAPRNIMVDENFQITGLFDWEMAGWYPDWWEMMRVRKAHDPKFNDWQDMMVETAPKEFLCDLRGINAAHVVIIF